MPVMALVSITHRISGIIIFLGMPILLWMLGKSLSSASEFEALQTMLENKFYKLVFLGILAALIYHIIAGIKHLIMDLGWGETETGAKFGALLVIALNVIAIIYLGMQL